MTLMMASITFDLIQRRRRGSRALARVPHRLRRVNRQLLEAWLRREVRPNVLVREEPRAAPKRAHERHERPALRRRTPGYALAQRGAHNNQTHTRT